MSNPVILAHGALGNFDEVIFISVIVVFIVMMGISWVRSRDLAGDPAALTLTPEADPPTDRRDHVELE